MRHCSYIDLWAKVKHSLKPSAIICISGSDTSLSPVVAPPSQTWKMCYKASILAGGCKREAKLVSSDQTDGSPAQPSLCPCGRSAWFLSAQSSAAASSSPDPSAASLTSLPSAAGPLAWMDAASLSLRYHRCPPRGTRSWIELPNTNQSRQDRMKLCDLWSQKSCGADKTSAPCGSGAQSFLFFHGNVQHS